MAGGENSLAAYSVAELLDLFVANIREVEACDHTGRKNRLWARRKRILDVIKSATDGTERALLPLLSDPDPMVRLTAAIHLKSVDRDVAVAVIKALADRKDEIGREAQHSLRMEEFFKEHPSIPPPEKVPSPWDSRLSGHKPPAGITRDELEPMLFGAFPQDIATQVLALARPAIRVWPQPLDPNAATTCSRFGGLPAMPKDCSWPTVAVWPKGDTSWFKLPREEWPEFDQEPRWFLAQINCADLAGFASARAFPREGMLYFFGDSDVVTGCTGGGEHNGVFYWPTAKQLSVADVPVEDFEILPKCGLGFAEMLDLPDPFSREIEQLALPKELQDRYHDLRGTVSNYGVKAERFRELDRSKLFGWPDLVQGELDSLANASDPRHLLLQIGNYDNGVESHYWGPGGLIYFVIDDSDLAVGKVGRAECDFQCT
jgi:uncharacterized protein YwqG